MPSAKQLAANQANAKKSTGPRTPQGKLNSRANAVKHGLTGQVMMMTPSDQATYSDYYLRMIPDLAPVTTLEYSFADRIVFDSWRLSRSTMIEQNLFQLADGELVISTGDATQDDALNQALNFEVKEKTFTLLSLYQARIQRSLHKDLEMLRKIQKDRKAEAIQAAKPAAAAPKRSAQVVDFPATSPAIGSVCSTPPADPAPPPPAAATNPQNLAA